MGCVYSRTIAAVHPTDLYKEHADLLANKHDFEALLLDAIDIKLLWNSFDYVRDNYSYVLTQGYIESIDLKMSVFVMKIFTFYSKRDKIDFKSFVFSVWSYCSVNKTGLEEFVFHVYDESNLGYFSITTVLTLMVDLYGATLRSNKQAIE